MMSRRATRVLAVVMAALLVGGVVVAASLRASGGRTTLTAYFDNSNGMFRGDDVLMLGVPVGKIVSIEPQPQRAKVTFWVDDKYKVAADVKAVILSPELITARSIALTPMYTSGPALPSGAVIAQERKEVSAQCDESEG